MSAPILTVTLNPAIDQTVTLDALNPGHVHRARAVRADAGGKGVNVAACLADWGLPVTATGVLGLDNAAPFAALFARKGIDDRFVRVPGETRTNLKLLDAGRADTTDINLPGLAVTADTLAAVRAMVLDIATEGSLVVLAGSLPSSLHPQSYADLTRLLRARGARVVLDASGPALSASLAAPSEALPFAIKPNRHELEEWAGRALPSLEDVTAAARALHARGVAWVVVSLGAEGAVFVAPDGVVHARPPATEVTSTVGAGDALVAGLVTGLEAGLALEATARLALAFAAGKLGLAGANLPGRERVQAIADTIAVTRLDPDPHPTTSS